MVLLHRRGLHTRGHGDDFDRVGCVMGVAHINPPPVRLQTDEAMSKAGWAAWSRDMSGLLCTAHAPFESASEWAEYVNEETKRGFRVFYPDGKLKYEYHP